MLHPLYALSLKPSVAIGVSPMIEMHSSGHRKKTIFINQNLGYNISRRIKKAFPAL